MRGRKKRKKRYGPRITCPRCGCKGRFYWHTKLTPKGHRFHYPTVYHYTPKPMYCHLREEHAKQVVTDEDIPINRTNKRYLQAVAEVEGWKNPLMFINHFLEEYWLALLSCYITLKGLSVDEIAMPPDIRDKVKKMWGR